MVFFCVLYTLASYRGKRADVWPPVGKGKEGEDEMDTRPGSPLLFFSLRESFLEYITIGLAQIRDIYCTRVQARHSLITIVSF